MWTKVFEWVVTLLVVAFPLIAYLVWFDDGDDR